MSFRDRLAVTALVHLALALFAPAQAGQTWAVTLAVSVVFLCGAAMKQPDEENRDQRSP
ncbi:hypothetical protein [Actinokineospora sp. UTMC 2448]|uniref:hypothetical protein n=1 Tax=Actinokineospora sp. UTMC 2448 TaxID=2268449 RepID=UPI0021647BD0|nr:hypothetical protein [Actinokineospora sp. UTMC 2448]UVS79787.1 hypothetical protein Actkin_03537 [Actinokineospora sp. UTMC 2448]